MSRTPNQKKRMLHLLRLFVEQSSAENAFSVDDIIRYLDSQSISADRKTIYSDIALFREFGYDIIGVKDKSYTYYLASRTFELAELKLLADAVACSKFISEGKSAKLIRKIGTLTSADEARQLEREIIVSNRVKSTNEKVFYNVDIIHRAIVDEKMISFLYFDYGIDKHKVFRHDGQRYLVSPYALTWETENYYLLCDYGGHEGVNAFRVDKMENIVEEAEVRQSPPEDFSIARYSRRVFSMFGGTLEYVEILCHNKILTAVYDKFGKDVNIRRFDDEHFCITSNIAVSPTFFGWLAQFGSKAKITYPKRVALQLCDYLRESLEQYDALNDGDCRAPEE